MTPSPTTEPTAKRSVSYRLVSLIVMGIAVAVGVAYLVVGRGYDNGQPLGPTAFPTLLGILLIASCLVGVVVAVRQDDQRVPLGDLTGVALAALITAAYLILWDVTGWFYPATLLYLFGLSTYLRRTKPGQRSVMTDATVAAAMTGFVYLFFDLLLGVRF